MDEQVDRLVKKVLSKFNETGADRRFSKSATLTTLGFSVVLLCIVLDFFVLSLSAS